MVAVVHEVASVLERAARSPRLLLIDGQWVVGT
jgi:hypothetical protein